MKTKTVVGIMLTLLLVGMFTLAFGTRHVKAEPSPITVPDDYPTLQEAINSANEGDTIYVKSGTYYEHITIGKSLTITGEDRDTTIIDGSLNGTAVRIDADNVQINEFTIRNGYRGIYILNSDGNTVSQNNITRNKFEGLVIENSANNLVTNNLIGFNGGNGVYIFNASNTTLQSNTIASNSLTGVYMEASSSDTVRNNTLSNNTIFGIRLDDSNNISIVGNTISRNEHAGINFFNLIESVFYHNNLVNNAEQTSSDDSPNAWDNGYPSGGNYWSDYNGTDFYGGPSQNETGSDGIGDTQYLIDNVNRDSYTLMNPILFFDAGTWVGVPYNVSIVSNSTVSKFQLNEIVKTISFNVTGETGLGFCRVTVPNVIVQNLWQGKFTVLVDGGEPLMTNNLTDEAYTYIFLLYLHSEREVIIQASDISPPAISILSPEDKTYSVNSVLLTFTVNESSSWIGYSLDGQMNVTISGNTTLADLSDGAHSLRVYANDTAGNMGYSDTVYFAVDTVPPNIEIQSPENRTYTTSSVSLSYIIDELTSWIGYSLDGQENVTVTGNTTLSGLSDGSHNLVVYANDTAGNTGSSYIVYLTILDTASPSISILSPENKTYATISIPLSFTIDESVLWMSYSLDSKANVTVTGNTTLSGLSDGSHHIVVYASDTAGNTGTSEMIYFTIETQQEEASPIWTEVVIVIIVLTIGAIAGTALFRKHRRSQMTPQ